MKRILVLAILLTICCGGGEEQTQVVSPEKPVQIAKSVLMVIAPEDFRDEEFKEPYDLFTKSGLKVTVASTDTLPAKGMLGMVVKPDLTLEQVIPDLYDVLLVVGGTGCEVLWDNVVLHSIIQAFNRAGKTIAAICIAPVVLARAGILKDIEVTAYPAVKDEIANCGGCYVKADVKVCEKIITGSGPKTAKDFATTILNELSE